MLVCALQSVTTRYNLLQAVTSCYKLLQAVTYVLKAYMNKSVKCNVFVYEINV